MRLLALLAPSLSVAAHLTLSVPSAFSLPASTHALLLGAPGAPPLDTPLRRDNTLQFPSLVPGEYLVTLHSRDYNFAPLRVDVGAGAEGKETVQVWQTFRGHEWSNKGVLLGSSGAGEGTSAGNVEIEVRPVGRKEYYQQRQGFSVLSLLKSPMILMGLVSVVMIFGLPKLMENMDPETKAEFEEMQKKQGSGGGMAGSAQQIQNFDLAGWMAGTSGESGGGQSGKKK